MKEWVVDYAVRRGDGSYFEDRTHVSVDSLIEAAQIVEAVLKTMMSENGWENAVVWNVGVVGEVEEEVC